MTLLEAGVKDGVAGLQLGSAWVSEPGTALEPMTNEPLETSLTVGHAS